MPTISLLASTTRMMRKKCFSLFKERLGSFSVALHERKTRLIEFGRFAALSRQRCGARKPETFAFLGFIHYCGGVGAWIIIRAEFGL